MDKVIYRHGVKQGVDPMVIRNAVVTEETNGFAIWEEVYSNDDAIDETNLLKFVLGHTMEKRIAAIHFAVQAAIAWGAKI